MYGRRGAGPASCVPRCQYWGTICIEELSDWSSYDRGRCAVWCVARHSDATMLITITIW